MASAVLRVEQKGEKMKIKTKPDLLAAAKDDAEVKIYPTTGKPHCVYCGCEITPEGHYGGRFCVSSEEQNRKEG